ncbi:ABC transporter permease [Seongchinamella unica]|uniref:ABC transporter permease n=2 Tax=Seongchinamella TaxID=2919372 RepID=A0A4R5LTL1_9GAMM|nr:MULTISPECIES: ABC transporter permease subunit [Seongchinamella]RLQ20505.1 ABC transporter permease [Seongchinamella sediminis]TDG14706.1 ABC transporter permease [Seongchinamella unica]
MRPVFILAAEEFREGLRNRWVISALLLLGALAFSLALLGSSPIGETRASSLNVTTVSLASLSVYLIPLIALTLSHDSIVGERNGGTLLLLLTYPVRRWQIVVGKFVGHVSIIAVAIVFGYGVSAIYVGATAEVQAQDWQLFASMVGSSLLLGSVFIALGFLVSVVVSSPATAAGVSISLWLFLVVVFDLLLLGLVLVDSENLISTELFAGLLLLNPADIYRLFNLAGSDAASLVSGSLGALDDSFLSPGLLLGVLTLWLVLPLASAIWIFRRHEL